MSEKKELIAELEKILSKSQLDYVQRRLEEADKLEAQVADLKKQLDKCNDSISTYSTELSTIRARVSALQSKEKELSLKEQDLLKREQDLYKTLNEKDIFYLKQSNQQLSGIIEAIFSSPQWRTFQQGCMSRPGNYGQVDQLPFNQSIVQEQDKQHVHSFDVHDTKTGPKEPIE